MHQTLAYLQFDRSTNVLVDMTYVLFWAGLWTITRRSLWPGLRSWTTWLLASAIGVCAYRLIVNCIHTLPFYQRLPLYSASFLVVVVAYILQIWGYIVLLRTLSQIAAEYKRRAAFTAQGAPAPHDDTIWPPSIHP